MNPNDAMGGPEKSNSPVFQVLFLNAIVLLWNREDGFQHYSKLRLTRAFQTVESMIHFKMFS